MNFIRSKLRVTRFLSLSLSLVQARSTRTRETRLHRITSGQRCVISLGGRKPKIAPVRIWYTGRSNGPSLKVVKRRGEAIKRGRTIKKTELPSKRSAHKRRRGRDFPPRDGRSTMEARFLGENKRVVYTWTRNVNNEEVRLGWFARHN